MPEVIEQASRMASDATSKVTRLRGDLESAMQDRVGPGYDRVTTIARNAVEQVRGHSETVAAGVRGWPLLSIAAVAVVSFVFGRASR
jgi:hypothetical protein